MTPQQVKASICALFEVKEEGGVLSIQTPLRNLANDQIMVYATPLDGGDEWIIDDNGDTAFALSMAGHDISTDTFSESARLACGERIMQWDADSLEISMLVKAKDIGIASLMVAAASSRLINAIASRKERKKSDFKERLMSLLVEVAHDAGQEVEIDAHVDGDLLKADCKINTPVPTFIIIATSSERLTEAELIHSRLQVNHQPGYVLAVVESIATVGKGHYRRASYFTDKAIEYDDAMFDAFLKTKLIHDAPPATQ